MKTYHPQTKTTHPRGGAAQRRRGERGAAMLTAMLTSMLLLVGGGALLVTTTLSATNAIDSTAEAQAYYAAESGIQATLDVLRGNVQPNPAPGAAGSTLNAINFRRAVYRRDPLDPNAPSSNLPNDNSNEARLSRWLTYSAGFPDRVTISPNYNPFTGTAYSVTVNDPDRSDTVRYSTTARFIPTAPLPPGVTVSANPARLTVVAGASTLTLTYDPHSAANSITAYPPVASDLGTLTITAAGPGLVDLAAVFGTNLPLLRINIAQTEPWTSNAYIEGRLSGTVSISAGGGVTPALRVNFPTPSTVGTNGAVYTLPAAQLNLSALTNTVQSTVAADAPQRLFIRSTGFGPRGAQKRLQLLVTNNALNVRPPATITIAGCAPLTDFSIGDSNASDYSGYDRANLAGPRPVFGVDCNNQNAVNTEVANKNPDVAGVPSGQLGADMPKPDFLQTADAARQFLIKAEQMARERGRYFTSKPANLGTDAAPEFTFIDNAGGSAVQLGSHLQGVGMLIVTGKLETSGNTSFKGIILVLGEGVVERQGGGNGEMLGAIIVAKFPRPGPGDFQSATFNFGGGGTQNTQYDQNEVNRALGTVGMGILGLAEY